MGCYQFDRLGYDPDGTVIELGLLDYGARFYDPAISRFTSIDPLATDFPSWNPYHYVHNNPILLIDATGMSTDTVRAQGEDGTFSVISDEGSYNLWLWNNGMRLLQSYNANGQASSTIVYYHGERDESDEGQGGYNYMAEDGRGENNGPESDGTTKIIDPPLGRRGIRHLIQQEGAYVNAEGYFDNKIDNGATRPALAGMSGEPTGLLVTSFSSSTGDSVTHFTYNPKTGERDTINTKAMKSTGLFGGKTKLVRLPKKATVKNRKK